MAQRHLIDKVSMEIGLKQSGLAYDYQSQCSELLQDELTHVIQGVCDQFSNPDQHIIVDRLELDLGKISAQDFKWDFLHKFKDKFSLTSIQNSNNIMSDAAVSAFTQSISALGTHSNKDISRESMPDRDQDSRAYQWSVIKHFLAHGSLPWYVDLQDYEGIDKALDGLLQDNFPIVSGVREIVKDTVSLTRLLSQLKQTTISKLQQRVFGHKVNWLEVFDMIESSLAQLEHRVQFVPRIQIWTLIWHQPDGHVNSVLSSIWNTILHSNSALAPMILNRLQQDLAVLSKQAGLDKDIFISSLEAARQQYHVVEAEHTSTTHAPEQTVLRERAPALKNNTEQALETGIDANRSAERAPESGKMSDQGLVAASTPAQDEKNASDAIQYAATKQIQELQSSNSPDQAQENAKHSAEQLSIDKRLGEFHERIRQQGHIDDGTSAHKEIETPFAAEVQDAPELDRYALHNAGLVIFWPYLQAFFQQLGLLQENQFLDRRAQQKAIHLLQYLASAAEQVEEYALPLNKILCNWPLQQPIDRFITLDDEDREESHNLIQAVIKNWSALGKTSEQNLRYSFILRKGLLKGGANGWILQIEKGPYDVLLDRIPWSLSMIKLPWMEQLLQVEW